MHRRYFLFFFFSFPLPSFLPVHTLLLDPVFTSILYSGIYLFYYFFVLLLRPFLTNDLVAECISQRQGDHSCPEQVHKQIIYLYFLGPFFRVILRAL